MRVVLFVQLFLSVAFCEWRSCHNCDRNCQNKYDNDSLAEACIQGCHLSPGLKARTDDYNVNLDCEDLCKNFTSDDLRSACYAGCSHIPSAPLDTQSLFEGIFNLPWFSSIFFGKNDKSGEPTSVYSVVDDEKPIIRETHIRIFIPDGPSVGENMVDDEDVKMLMNAMHSPESNEFPMNGLHPVRVRPSTSVDSMSVPHFARNLCFRARAAFHHLTTHPLFMASVILMFVSSVTLLIFACYRLNVRRTRRAVFKRQYEKMPAFFKSPSVHVNLTKPQEPQSDDDEAPILPTKEPIV